MFIAQAVQWPQANGQAFNIILLCISKFLTPTRMIVRFAQNHAYWRFFLAVHQLLISSAGTGSTALYSH